MFSATLGLLTCAALCTPTISLDSSTVNNALAKLNDNTCIVTSTRLSDTYCNSNIQSILDQLNTQNNCIVVKSNISLSDCGLSLSNLPIGNLPGTCTAPETGNPQPETTVPQPETTAPQPETTAPQPETTAPQPETTAPQPETTAPAETKPEQTTPAPSENQDVAIAIVNRVNQERAKAGLAPLTLSTELSGAAQIRAREIQSSFSHTRPNGSSFSSVLKEQNISYQRSGENIAWGQKTAEIVMNAWMNSDGHRANILNANFTKIGVGYEISSSGTPYWAQLFTN